MDFPCTMCGACCKSIGMIMQNKDKESLFQKEIEDFPYGTDKDGVCEKLTEKGCSVYSDRPDLCNTKTIYDRHYSHMSKRDYLLMTMSGCGALIELFGIDKALTPKFDN